MTPNEKSKQLLKAVIDKKLKTSFIFAIAQLEEKFGHLWDPQQENSEVEGSEYYADLFQQFRKAVLDNGNNQIRNMEKDLDESFEVAFKKHTIYFKGQGNG
jgi:hypothetical protein